MKILVYNDKTNKMETYYRDLDEPMPYIEDNYLTVGEFRGSSNTDTLWTDRRLMDAFNQLRNMYGSAIPVRYAFKRIAEGGHSNMSQHYAGMAMDMAQALTNEERNAIRQLAIDSNLFTYVEPAELTPTWVHVDTRNPNQACPTGGYPLIKKGDKGVYVLVLQDALNTLGYNAGNIDGIFGNNTKNAVIRFQNANGLSADGIVGCNTWTALTADVANTRFLI